MKKLIVVVGLLFFFSNASSQWIQISNGMGTNKIVWSLAVKNNNIFAGTEEGVYISTNNGDYWEKTSFNNQQGNILLVNENNIYLGTDSGVFLSTNNGQNWVQTELKHRRVWSFAVKGNNIFAGTAGHGVYLSTNNGVNWQQSGLTNYFISSLAVSGNNIFAGDWESPTVFRSTNNGTNWMQTYLGYAIYRVVLCLAVKENYIFAGTDNYGVFYSSNNGINWTQTVLNNFSVLSIKTNSNYLFVGATSYSSGGVYLSSNNGVSWILRNQGLNPFNIWSLITTSQYIFAGTDSSVWRRSLSEIIGIQKISTNIPDKFSFSQNYPNPFNPTTSIRYKVESRKFIRLIVYDILGKEIATLVNEKLNAGEYEVQFPNEQLTNVQLPSGVYFYSLFAEGNLIETKKMVLLK